MSPIVLATSAMCGWPSKASSTHNPTTERAIVLNESRSTVAPCGGKRGCRSRGRRRGGLVARLVKQVATTDQVLRHPRTGRDAL